MTRPNLAFRVLAAALLVAGISMPATGQAAGLDDRDSEPVVLTGAGAPSLIGIEPGSVVAFAWHGSWQQVPVQVDERKLIDYRPVRQLGFSSTNEFREMAYADPNTWAEADGVPQTVTNPSNRGAGAVIPGTTGDPMLDENDEIAMMAADAGTSAAGESDPNGVASNSRTPVRITDPLDPGKYRFIYLFQATGQLDPGAGTDYVSYQQTYSPALSGGYRTGYNYSSIGDNVSGPPVNPEVSVVQTPRYEIGIPGRWMIDRLVIAAGAGNVDILDGDKSTVTSTGCGRNELTFSRGGGGFIANIDGPVRAIRSFIGANSGTFTQREYVFYKGMWENRTFLRVHPGINQFVTAMDLSPDAAGMTYRNQLNPAGVTVDGVQDAPVAGPFDWEQLSGAQGSVTNIARFTTDIEGVNRSSYYQDMATPSPGSSMLCSGDDHSYGAAGPMLTTPLNNTDPTLATQYPTLPVSHFSSVRYSWFGGPEADAALAGLRSQQVDNPLAVETGAAVDPAPEPDPDPDPDPSGRAELKVSLKPGHFAIRPGKSRKLSVLVRNTGDASATGVSVCVRKAKWIAAPLKCRQPSRIEAGGKVRITVNLKVRRSAGPGRRVLRIKATGKGAAAGASQAAVRVKRR